MLNRRAFLCGTICTAIALPVATAAQPARKTARIGWIALSPGPTPAQLDVFRRGMRERGWIEGQNLVLDVRGGDRERARELVAELVRQHVDVIVTQGPMALGALGESVSTPLVFVFSGDPVEAGLVSSITRPGTNLTGLTLLSLDLVGKRLELLKEALPTLSRVAILANQEHPGVRAELRESQAAAERLGLRAQYVPVRGVGDFDGAFQEIARERADAIVAFPDILIMRQAAAIAAFAAKRGIPAVSGWAGFAIAGNLLSYGPNIDESFRIIATQVDKILRGARPGDLPIEQPTTFELVINARTAKALGLTIPPSLLLRADQVIE